MSTSERKIGALIIGTSVVQSLKRIAPHQQDVFREELEVEPFYYQRSGQEEIQLNAEWIHEGSYKFFFKEVIKEPAKLSILLYNLSILLESEKFQQIVVKDDKIKDFTANLQKVIASCLEDLKKINSFMESETNGFSENHFSVLNELYGTSHFSDTHANRIFNLHIQLSYLEALIRPQQEMLSGFMHKLAVIGKHIFTNPYRPGAEPSAEEKGAFRQSLIVVLAEIKKQGNNFFIEHADIFGGTERAQRLQNFFSAGIDIDVLEKGIIHNSQDPLKEGSGFSRDVNADIYLETVSAITMAEQTARGYLCNASLQVQAFQYITRLESSIAETTKRVCLLPHPIAAELKKKIMQFNQFQADGVALDTLGKLYAEDKSENSLQALFLGEGIFKRGTFDIYSPLDGYLRTLPKEKYRKELESIRFLKTISQLNYKKEFTNENDIEKSLKRKNFISKIIGFKLIMGELNGKEVDQEKDRLNRLSTVDLVKEVAGLSEKALLLAIPVLALFSQTEYFSMITRYDPTLPPHPKTNNSLGPKNELSLLLNEIERIKEISWKLGKEKGVAEVAVEQSESRVSSQLRRASLVVPESHHNFSEQARTVSMFIPSHRAELSLDSSQKESFPRARPAMLVEGIKSRRDSSERAPSPPSTKPKMLVEATKSRRDSSERAPSPPTRPASEPGVTMSVEELHRDSVERTPSPSYDPASVVASSGFSSSSGSEFESPQSPCKDSEGESVVKFNEEEARADNSPPSPIQVAPNAFSFFEQPPKVQEKPSSIFSNENVEQKNEFLRKLQNKTFTFKRDRQLVLNLSAAGNPTALYLLAQAARKGDGGLNKDPVAAYYLAKLALRTTINPDSQVRIMDFLGTVPLRDAEAKCLPGLKIRIHDQDYDPRKLWEAYLEQKSAVQAPKVSMGYSQ